MVKEGNTRSLSPEEAEQRYHDAHRAYLSLVQKARTTLSHNDKKTLADAVDALIPLYQEANAREHTGYDTALSLDNRAVFLRDSILWYAARFLFLTSA